MLGSTIGDYTIARELGAGGMGTVYLAEAPEGRRRVAIKVVHPHLIATPGFFKRFLREAELGRKVEHPNVVRTLDVDATMVDDKQVNYMVMEYVEGKSLRDLLIQLRTIPETLLREVALQTAAGLAAIHAADIVHRDLKPENVLITDDNEVRIMDLGVAKLQEASIAITKEGQFAGSVLYAAPESFRSEEVGPSADLYSLGVMLHELATGENPFRRDDAAAVIQAHLTHAPPRVDERNSEVSSFLTEVTATLLAKNGAERFASATALHDVLADGEGSAWWKEHAPKVAKRDAHLPKIRVHRETELHGRTEDLALLRSLFERASAGSGNTVLIEGEAGIGKTRFVDAFVREVEDAHVLYGSYPPSGGLGGMSDAIVGKFGGAGELADALRPYLPDTPTLVPAFAALVKHEAPPSGAEPLHGDALHAICVQLMRSLAAERPTVWIVDDLQFADKESRDLVLSLARATEGHRALLLAASRPGLPEEELAHFSRLENVKRVNLGRLSPREILDLLADAFKSESLAEKLGGKIALKSDGVPFFVFEMIRGLKEGQFLQQTADGSYVQTQMVTDIEVPSAVKDLIDGRMKGLTEGQRAILDVGAVQGMTFHPGLVAAVLEEKKVRVLRDIAEIERRFGLVRGEESHIRFDQNQIQEVLYSGLIPDLRREYHTLLAEASEDDDPVFLAHHHLRGSKPKTALPHLKSALEHLDKAYRNEAQLDLARRALDVDGLLEGEERVDVLLRQGRLLDHDGRRDESRAAFDEALALADAIGEPVVRGRTRQAQAVHFLAASQNEAALATLQEALELAPAAGDKRLETHITGSLGSVFSNLGRYADAQEHHERARMLYRDLGDRPGEGGATGNLGLVAWRRGRYAEAREHFERSRALARESGNRRSEAIATGNLGLILSELGRHAEAKELYERHRVVARELGYRQGEAISTGNLGWAFACLGHLEEALKHYERHRSHSREIGFREGEAIATGNVGDVLRMVGRLEEAREFHERAVALAREIGDRRTEGYAFEGLACDAEAEGDPTEAGRLYEELLSLRRELGEQATIADTLVGLGRVKTSAAHLDEALVLARETQVPATILAATIERARLPGGDVASALVAVEEHEERTDHEGRMEARFRLWQLTNDRAHLEEAQRLLDSLVEHAPEDCRDSMIENVPLHKEIRSAG